MCSGRRAASKNGKRPGSEGLAKCTNLVVEIFHFVFGEDRPCVVASLADNVGFLLGGQTSQDGFHLLGRRWLCKSRQAVRYQNTDEAQSLTLWSNLGRWAGATRVRRLDRLLDRGSLGLLLGLRAGGLGAAAR